jgi:glutaredoxin
MHGPELTDCGTGKHNLDWQIKHFLNPQKIVPESKMPNFEFTQEEATALAYLMKSFDGERPPHNYIPATALSSATTGFPSLSIDELGVDVDSKAAPGYVGSKTCLKCHTTLHPGLPDIWQNSKMGQHAFVAVRDVSDNQVCLQCHTTGYNPATNVFVEPNVGCEACHGPGKEYVGFILSGKRDEHKARARANVLQKDRCVHCHRAPHVAKEKHAEHMRHLVATQSLFQNKTSEQDPELQALVDYLKNQSGETIHDQSATLPDEFGVMIDHRALPGHVGSESCLFCHRTLHADVAHHWESSKKAHTFEAIRDVPQREACLPCHTTGFNPETNVFVERNVGCEACHAPGRDYVMLLMQGKRQEHAQIAKEMGTSSNRCIRCHQIHVARDKHVETIRSGEQSTLDRWSEFGRAD